MHAATAYPDVAAQLRDIGPQIEVPRTTQLYRTLHPPGPAPDVSITRDLRYGPHERHVLDLFTLSSAQRTARRPVVVFVHGGGFRVGAKQLPDQPFHDNVGIWAARAGLVGVTISYRLAPEFVYPSGIQDMDLALSQVAALANDWGADARQVFVWGHSAGAGHAADYIVTHDEPQLAGAILTSGIFDKSGGVPESPWSSYYGTDTRRYPQLSAIPGLSTCKLPLMITWGELDRADFIADSEALVAARRKAGRAVTALCVANHSHISEIYAIGTADTSLTDPVLDFIKTVSEGLS